MTLLPRLASVLFLLTFLACTPEEPVRLSPTPSLAPTTAAPSATPTRTASPVATTASPSPAATATPTPTTSPGDTPNAVCASRTGGSAGNRAILNDVRIAHNPGFDRVVFEFSPSSGPGSYGAPPFQVGLTNSFTATSGQSVRVDGSVFYAVNFQQADAHDPQTGRVVLPPAKFDQKPSTPLIREVRLVEDFEATVRWAVGLDRIACPTVLTLASPVRVVVDFPTPP